MFTIRTVLLSGLLLSAWQLSAQQTANIKGRIVDVDGVAIEYASITVFLERDSSLHSGVVSDEAGNFSLEKIPVENIYIIAQFLGYEPYQSEVFVPERQTDLGVLTLSVSASILQEVEVKGREITSLHQLDKQVFDAGQFRNAQGGTATDVLRNLPSISVNALGEISVRGTTGFIVMINGKPVQTDPAAALGRIAANAIEDVEIITAPSAKYDPDGGAGIINIKTRRGATDGLFLIANARIGLPSLEPYDNAEAARRYGGDVTLNVIKRKWDISAGFDYSRDDLAGRREGYVNTYIDEVLTEFPSDGERSFNRENYSGRASFRFAPDERQTIGAGFFAGKRTQYRTADILYFSNQKTVIPNAQFLGPEAYWDQYKANGRVLDTAAPLSLFTYYNENLRVRRGDFLIAALDYSLQTGPSSTLKISGLYERTILGGPTDNLNLAWPNTLDTLQLQYNDNDNPLDGYRLQMDFSSKLGVAKWESGYQFRYLNHPGDFIYLDRNFDTGTWEENSLFTNRIELKRQIHSVYSQLSGSVGKLQYAGGLRLEYFNRQVDIAKPDTLYQLDRFNLFPSLNLQYDLGNGLALKGGYSRRIERTTTFKMTPFPEREHSETLEQGDATLLPEYIDLAEVGLVRSWEDNSVYATAYFRKVANVINRVNTIFNDTILNRIYTNAGQARVLGLEMGTTLYPASWWRLFLGGNVYHYRIKGQLFGDAISTANVIYSINATTDFKLSGTMDLQVGLNYLSEQITAQGRDSRFYNPSLSLRKTFLDKKLAVSLQWLNMDMGLLQSNEQRITTVRDDFYTTTNYVYEVDILMLGVMYQLNRQSKKVELPKIEFGEKEF
ncbi:MAG: TonB-dependent receptor [Saprospiraceae bacterium]|nr:TonB-dependent receptor [Lewinella sp.]